MFMIWNFYHFFGIFKSFPSGSNPLAPVSDQIRTPFYNVNIILSRLVMRMKKL